MNFEIINHSVQRVPRQFLDFWHSHIDKELKRLKVKGLNPQKTLYLVFLEPKEAKKLNKKFRGKNKVTDVLSFESADPASYGELIFSPDLIKKQAEEHELSYREELAYLITHGLLHLLGYEHEHDEKKAKEMFAIQDKVFDRLCQKWASRR